jgi:peptidoglycan/LPS O-acetylase OafA/YrhL
MKYRREIDGLRALAVLPVVLFHAKLPYFDGGFLGVDIFFVISGYLITSLIVEDLEKGNFSIVDFYERRIRRILPALYAVLIFSLVMTVVFMDPDELRALSLSALSANFFSSNVYFWQQSGYFGSEAELTPLLHTWSLSVEEQFYVLFPIFLIVVWRFGPNSVIPLIVAGAVVSLGIAQWGSRHASLANFFLLPTRGWELMVGAFVALLMRRQTLEVSAAWCNVLSLIGIAALASAFYFFEPDTPHPSVLTLVPVLGTALIIVFTRPESPVGIVLSNRYVVGLGLISYSVYLWHYPIFAFTRAHLTNEDNFFLFGGLSVLSLALGYLSWSFIERPFRDRKAISRRQIFTYAGASTVAIVAVASGLAMYNTLPLKVLSPDGFARYTELKAFFEDQPNRMVNAGCHIHSKTFSAEFMKAFDHCAEKYGKAIFVTGGSHGMDLYNAIAMNSDYPFIASVSAGWCRAHKPINQQTPHPCHYDDLLVFAAEHADEISMVIYTQTPDRLFFNRMTKATTNEDLSVSSITEVIDYMHQLREQSGVKVLIVGPLPPIAKNPKKFFQELSWKQPIKQQLYGLISKHLLDLTRHVDVEFCELSKTADIPYISKIDAFEINLPTDLIVYGKLTYSDRRHLSAAGEKEFGARLVRRLCESGFREFCLLKN